VGWGWVVRKSTALNFWRRGGEVASFRRIVNDYVYIILTLQVP